MHFDLCICAIVSLSSMASVAAQGSDSHDAPLLFVLLCESSAQLCLPFTFHSARCLSGKVSISSLSFSSDLYLSFIRSLILIGHCYPFPPHSSLIYCLFPLHGNQIRRNSYFPFAPVCFFFFLNVKPLPPAAAFCG